MFFENYGCYIAYCRTLLLLLDVDTALITGSNFFHGIILLQGDEGEQYTKLLEEKVLHLPILKSDSSTL